MTFDLWIHLLELAMVGGIAFTIWYTKTRGNKRG